MTYKLKTVKYQNSLRKILLQNENGPCPLLACANALLLRGVISLPSACIRNGVASIDDVVNILAERALKRAAEQAEAAQNASEWKVVSSEKVQSDISDKKKSDPGFYHHESHEHHIDELLSLFPNLQYGMDVNPHFTQGSSGVEYTKNITAFDLLGVELVHGWLLDPQDTETFKLVGGKSYNELIELVIRGTEAASEVERLGALIEKKKKTLETTEISQRKENGAGESDWVSVASGNIEKDSEREDERVKDDDVKESSNGTPALSDENKSLSHEEYDQGVEADTKSRIVAEEEVANLQKEHHEKSALASNGCIVNSFLTSSSHQLTHHGLHELHNYISEECLCVFFRNNHFATMTKHDGVLYLLVTDLGYANVSEVVWEKLDSISGDTELFDEFFVRPKPRKSLTAADGPALSPEALLAQRGRSEADYQLALELSSGNGGRPRTREEMDEEEGKLIAAATEASLKEWNGDSSNSKNESATNSDTQEQVGVVSPEDADRAIALALHAKMNENHESSEMLARRLQAEENCRAAAARQRRSAGVGRPAPDRAAQPSGVGSNCVIS